MSFIEEPGILKRESNESIRIREVVFIPSTAFTVSTQLCLIIKV